jgi:hypothetical protein
MRKIVTRPITTVKAVCNRLDNVSFIFTVVMMAEKMLSIACETIAEILCFKSGVNTSWLRMHVVVWEMDNRQSGGKS